MKHDDRVASSKFCWSFDKLLHKHKSISWLLFGLTVLIPWGVKLESNKVIARPKPSVIVALDNQIVYVNPKSGDNNNDGTKFSPLQTITQALKIAKSGTTIQLAAGEYNEESGEIFPLVIKDKITLQGNANGQGQKTIIRGGGDFVSPTGAGQNVAIAALRNAGGIVGVTITNNSSRGHGLWVESSSPTIASNTFTRNGNTGLSINGKSQPVVEDNYFYNNSGNGLLVYGTSQAQIVNNTFEQTGFGISLIQNANVTIEENYFDGNRIGIILEGSSQATLRDNEIINSAESGLTAIATSLVDLGTDDEAGNNVFRSNRKLDIQNASSNEIVAVGTEINGETIGNINFDRGTLVASNNNSRDIRPLLPPLDSNKPTTSQTIPVPPAAATNPSLPSPPPVSETKTSTKEFVFTADSPSISEIPETEPVPFLPEVNNSTLGGNNSQISSLSDVLGSRSGVTVKYKVLVEAETEYIIREVRSLYPEAFSTIYQGKPVLQIGAFNNWDKAKQAKRSLENLGLDTHILE